MVIRPFLIDVLIADLEIAAAQFGGDVHQVGKRLAAPAVAHVKVKTAPVMVLDEVAVRRIRALMRFQDRRWMHSAVEPAHFVGRVAQIF